MLCCEELFDMPNEESIRVGMISFESARVDRDRRKRRM